MGEHFVALQLYALLYPGIGVGYYRGHQMKLTLKAGHHRHASVTLFECSFAGVPMMDQR